MVNDEWKMCLVRWDLGGQLYNQDLRTDLGSCGTVLTNECEMALSDRLRPSSGGDYGEGFLGITLGPILLVVGFVIEFAAILVRSTPSAEMPVPPAHPGVAAPVVAPVAAPPVVPPPAPAKPTYKRL